MIERPGAAARRPPPADLRHRVRRRSHVEIDARRWHVHIFRCRARRPCEGRRAHAQRLEHADSRPSQCAQRAGGHRGGERGRHRRRHDQGGDRRLLRRQAALPACRRVERRVDLRRLWPSPGRDRRRAEGSQGWRARARDRRGRAASLHARARSICEFAACFKDADSVIVTPLYSAGELPIDGIDHAALADAIRERDTAPSSSSTASANIAPVLTRFAKPGDMSSASAPATAPEWAHALPGWLTGEPLRAGGAA